MKVMAKLINPHAINMFCAPDRSSQGLIANGMPMLMALRMKATPVKASPVICLRKTREKVYSGLIER